MSNSLWPHESQHTRLPCPSTPGVYSNPYSSSRWCHPAISSSVIPFSCPKSLPASESFPMSQLFTSGGQSTGVSASALVLPMNTQDWSPLGWTATQLYAPIIHFYCCVVYKPWIIYCHVDLLHFGSPLTFMHLCTMLLWMCLNMSPYIGMLRIQCLNTSHRVCAYSFNNVWPNYL